MFLQLIFSSPAVGIVWLIAIFLSLTVHEFAHAYSAKLLGDRTAERQGRLTLNPISHIDPMGLIPLLLFGFGWAKPVPFNPYNMKNPKWDSVTVAIAGPLSNLVLAIISAVIMRFLVVGEIVTSLNLLIVFLFLMVFMNLLLMFFNLIPVHPLDGSKLAFALLDKPQHQQIRQLIAQRGPQLILLLVLIAILLPIDVFFFVRIPSVWACDALIGESCMSFFSQVLSAAG